MTEFENGSNPPYIEDLFMDLVLDHALDKTKLGDTSGIVRHGWLEEIDYPLEYLPAPIPEVLASGRKVSKINRIYFRIIKVPGEFTEWGNEEPEIAFYDDEDLVMRVVDDIDLGLSVIDEETWDRTPIPDDVKLAMFEGFKPAEEGGS